jgi:hypothetical protein
LAFSEDAFSAVVSLFPTSSPDLKVPMRNPWISKRNPIGKIRTKFRLTKLFQLQKKSNRRHQGFDAVSKVDAQYLEQGVGEKKDLVKAAAITNYWSIEKILMLKIIPVLVWITVLVFQRIW